MDLELLVRLALRIRSIVNWELEELVCNWLIESFWWEHWLTFAILSSYATDPRRSFYRQLLYTCLSPICKLEIVNAACKPA